MEKIKIWLADKERSIQRHGFYSSLSGDVPRHIQADGKCYQLEPNKDNWFVGEPTYQELEFETTITRFGNLD